ncbi:hypothetical protein KAT24_01190 [Candidatus Pacearchaeota archaeon]|nr:hypothetical protein [Candidatus Pacearchaeota archaeon]
MKLYQRILAVGGVVASLAGCGYIISQEGVDKVVEEPVKEWVKTSNNYMNVHQLIRDENYEEAQAVLVEYLRQQIREGAECIGTINGTDKISKTATEKIGKTIDGQIDKIEAYLKFF